MFEHSVTTAYDLTDATWEIIIMLATAFLLGWFFRYLWDKDSHSELAIRTVPRPERYSRFDETHLQIVEGIGPKIEELLKANGIHTWHDLATASQERLKAILATGGERFQMHDPATWPDQVSLALDGKWEELEEYQTLLPGGRLR
jgi:hypothetical protein